MKKKLFIGVIGGLFAVFSILSVNTSLSNTGDVSLKNIAVMAKANAEDDLCPSGCYACGDFCHCFIDYYWLREAN